MLCRYCKQEIESDSIFCRYCGEKVARSRKKQIRVPKPTQLADGTYVGQIMVDGVRQRVYGVSVSDYEFNARALKSHLSSGKDPVGDLTLETVIDRYIDSNRNVLSPSTVMGYTSMKRCRFKGYLQKKISSIDWQEMISAEAKVASAKTVANAWNLVAPALNAVGYRAPAVNLPQRKRKDMLFLDYQQIQKFLEAIKGHTGELAAILALHSLRMSELLAVTTDDVVDGVIRVNKSVVPDETYSLVTRDINKTVKSTRDIPVMIPRLYELLPESGKLVNIVAVTIEKAVHDACRRAGLPDITPHDLRRSFASLAYHLGWKERSVMQIGGWSNMTTVHNIYIKLSTSDLEEDVKKMQDYYKFTRKPSEPQ